VSAGLAAIADANGKTAAGRARAALSAFFTWAIREGLAEATLDAALDIVAPWRLRRTVATRLADLGVQPHVIEALLNHVSGHKAGVAGTYNRSLYSAERRRALDLWATHVIALVAGREST
jgi:hypothetical protein